MGCVSSSQTGNSLKKRQQVQNRENQENLNKTQLKNSKEIPAQGNSYIAEKDNRKLEKNERCSIQLDEIWNTKKNDNNPLYYTERSTRETFRNIEDTEKIEINTSQEEKVKINSNTPVINLENQNEKEQENEKEKENQRKQQLVKYHCKLIKQFYRKNMFQLSKDPQDAPFLQKRNSSRIQLEQQYGM